ncbi:MAG: hypothetical protein ACD_24C00532G0001 [uncultured bacterium]|nr:MAG: hypothetical protein ACD_24C00532G0001 [uncultured bacterium]
MFLFLFVLFFSVSLLFDNLIFGMEIFVVNTLDVIFIKLRKTSRLFISRNLTSKDFSPRYNMRLLMGSKIKMIESIKKK